MIFLLLLLSASFALAAAFTLRFRTYRRFFRYDARADQHYDFAGSDAVEVSVELDAHGFFWPGASGAWDCALLELPLEADLLGGLIEPWLEARTRHVYARQYFERGARGTRYLNLSALLSEAPVPGQRFWIHGCGLHERPIAARLLLFQNELLPDERALVVAPHPDDAEIAAFGLYRQTGAAVVTATGGDHGSFYRVSASTDDHCDRFLCAQIRAWDSITVPFFGGVLPDRAVNLGYFDATLAEMYAAPATPVAAPGKRPRQMASCRRLNASPLLEEIDVTPTWDSLVRDFIRVLEQVQPEVIATPHPLIDDHPDHAFCTLAVCEALAATNLTKGRLLLYTNHAPQTNLYPLGGTDGAVSLPPHFGEPLDFRSILSLPLSAEDERMKLLALEAMHDLRTLPSLEMAGWLELLRTFLAGARNRITGLDHQAASYFRRAVRPNEIFFVLPFSEAGALARRFLETWRAGQIEWHASA